MSARSARGPLGPGALADRLTDLPLAIESIEVELGEVLLRGYEDGRPRPTAIVSLEGEGEVGRGECVAWSPAEQARFAGACHELVPLGQRTLGALHDALAGTEPYHAAALEAAAIDLALHQAATNLFALSGRPARGVAVCRSLGVASVSSAGGPGRAVQASLAAEPWAHFKIDVDPEGWDESDWAALSRTERVVIADFKRRGMVEQVELAHRHLAGAWLEDPPPEALLPEAPWRSRVALDGYVGGSSDLPGLPVEPGALNVKPARVGGPLEALRLLEAAARAGWAAYIGGMFEAGPGRQQARVLASLFTADAWNDLAPLDDDAAGPGPLPMRSNFVGFHPGEIRKASNGAEASLREAR